ncbi:MAG TPA: glycosyltransferase family 2 protein, partial [Rhodospirillaceae bacterium]|nr:glycosyltransferase family 2 protein [Rhodospirillaceae bacterium]
MCFLRSFAESDADLQTPADVAVVIPSLLRPTLGEALESVFEQTFAGRIQVLVGIDKPVGDILMIDELCRRRPANVTVQLFYPGYSTSVRHGGLHPARDGGVLRCLLSYLANSRLVAYLDDDNWWDPDHLRQMCRAMETASWAYAFRWFVHPGSRRPICVDNWESVGPDGGVFKRQGGWVDPNCLMIDKLACEPV